jgi:hypothetical protein
MRGFDVRLRHKDGALEEKRKGAESALQYYFYYIAQRQCS